jgi:triosephosphate isomerase
MNLGRSIYRFGSAKKLFVGGNWKSNNTVQQSKDLVTKVINNLKFDASKLDVVIAPPFLHIPAVQQALTNKDVQIAAQNSSVYGLGAYTGEIRYG